MKKILIALVLLIVVGAGIWLFNRGYSNTINNETPDESEEAENVEKQDQEEEVDNTKGQKAQTIIGTSVDGNDITAYHYGTGDTNLLFVGGIHGGYEWNTALVAYQAMDYFEANKDALPENVRVTVIPVLNPDGLEKVVGTTGRFEASDVPSGDTVAGRFNTHNVDLNRNFDCDWQSTGVWQSQEVDGGSAAFSEPESKAFKQYVEANHPDAVVVWYSAAGGVFASNCHNGVLDETQKLTNLYAEASGYPAHESYDYYKITGDAVNWLAKNSIPGISVLLTTHTDTEWSKNKAGIEALLEYYGN